MVSVEIVGGLTRSRSPKTSGGGRRREVLGKEFEVFPSEEAGVVAIVPSDLDRVVAGELNVGRSDRDRDVFDIDDPNTADFIDTLGTRATASQETIRQLKRAVRPLQFEYALLLSGFDAERW